MSRFTNNSLNSPCVILLVPTPNEEPLQVIVSSECEDCRSCEGSLMSQLGDGRLIEEHGTDRCAAVHYNLVTLNGSMDIAPASVRI